MKTTTILYAAAVTMIIAAMVVLGRDATVLHYIIYAVGLLYYGKKLLTSFRKEAN